MKTFNVAIRIRGDEFAIHQVIADDWELIGSTFDFTRDDGRIVFTITQDKVCYIEEVRA